MPQGHWDGGQIGDRMTVNGKVSPYTNVARGQCRFRVLNASNFRAHHLFFSDRRPFHVIGNDAGLLDGPVVITDVRLTPGERADLVVDFSDHEKGEHVDLVNDQREAALNAIVTDAQPLPDVVRFASTGAKGHQQVLPARLRVTPCRARGTTEL